jgi:lipooligosaccharide transport system permease protein
MSTHDTALRVVPRIALGTHRSWRLVERNLTSSRDAWLVVVSGFFEPLFYLVALGIGVGALVGTLELGGESVSYREFVAPALLASAAMNGAVYESGNIFFKLKYAKTYEGVLATPMTVRDVPEVSGAVSCEPPTRTMRSMADERGLPSSSSTWLSA